MFRALLWKEWRELWVLPAAAAPLAVISFFAAKPAGPRLTADVWQATFSLWLVIAAAYIPSHLFIRGRSLAPSEFLPSRPLARFRLWWYKLLIGLTVIAAVALVLWVITTVLSGFYQKAGPFDFQRANTIRITFGVALFFWALSSLLAGLLKKEFSALLGTAVAFFILWTLWGMVSLALDPLRSLYEFLSENSPRMAVAFCMAAAPFMMASLAVFAGKGLAEPSRTRLLLAYGMTAFLFAIPTAAGAIYLSSAVAEVSEALPDEIRILDISRDRNRLLLRAETSGRDLFLSVDLAGRAAHVISERRVYMAFMNTEADTVAYERFSFNPLTMIFFSPGRIMISDFQALNKREAFRKQSRFSLPDVRWSLDDNYLGIIDNGFDYLGQGGFVAIGDPNGNVIGKHEFPMLESDSFMYPIGWDYRSRFYFWRSLDKLRQSKRIVCRVGIDDITPEEIPLLTANNYPYPEISPDGRWIVCSETFKDQHREKLWLYDISEESASPVSEIAYSYCWSEDGRALAYVEASGEEEGIGEDTPLPARLTVYEPASGETKSWPLGAMTVDEIVYVASWSLSNDYLFMTRSEGKVSLPFVLSLATGRFKEITPPDENWSRAYWITDNRLLWKVENRLIITQHDGSNPEEIFRVEDGKFYFYAEEQS